MSPGQHVTCPTDFTVSPEQIAQPFGVATPYCDNDLFTHLYSVVLPRKLTSKGIPAYFRTSSFGVVSPLGFCLEGTRPVNTFQLQFILWFNNILRLWLSV